METTDEPNRGFPGMPKVRFAPSPPPPTRFLYRAMHIDEFYHLAQTQRLAFAYEGIKTRSELWLTESLRRHASKYVVKRQGRELSTLARLEVSKSAYERIRSALVYQRNSAKRPAGASFFSLERLMKSPAIRERCGGQILDPLPPAMFDKINVGFKTKKGLNQFNEAIQEIRVQGPNGDAFNHIVTPDGIQPAPKPPGKVKMFLAENGAVVLAVVIDIALLSAAIHKSVESRDARPAVETAVSIAATTLASYAMGVAMEGAGAVAAGAATMGIATIVAALVAVTFELLWKPETPPKFTPVSQGPGPPRLNVDLSAARGAPRLAVAPTASNAPPLQVDRGLLNGEPDLNASMRLVRGAPDFEAAGQPITASMEFVEDNASLRVDETVAILENDATNEVLVISTSDSESSFEMIHRFDASDCEEELILGISRRIDEEDQMEEAKEEDAKEVVYCHSAEVLLQLLRIDGVESCKLADPRRISSMKT